MKKAVFFQREKDSESLSVTITFDDPANLVGLVIPEGCKYVALDFETPSEDDRLKFTHVDKVRFNNYDKPTKLVLDSDAFSEAIINKIRLLRTPLLSMLDNLQTRALIRGKTDLIQEIEADKQYLRDYTITLGSKNFSKTSELKKSLDPAFTTDYEAKYGKRILE